MLDNPINGEGLGFIFSSKYWEVFDIIGIFYKLSLAIETKADDSFVLFAKVFGTKALNIKHLKIMSIF